MYLKLFSSQFLMILFAMLSVFAAACEEDEDNTSPVVVETFPPNGSQNVDPSIEELSVTFNEPMMDKSWSWAYSNKDDFPSMTGQPHYVDNLKKNILPVKLETNKSYIIWINSTVYKNFKDKSGNILAPYRFAFKTR